MSRRRGSDATFSMITRLEDGLRARGLLTNLSGASRAVMVDGKPLGKTFLRDALKRHSASTEFVEAICLKHRISWDHVKTGAGPLLVNGPIALDGIDEDQAPCLGPDPLAPLENDLQALLTEWREVCARKHALEEQIASVTDLLHAKK